jgi:hypothetical protein
VDGDDEDEESEDEEDIDEAIATVEDDPNDKEIIKSWKDITGLRIYNGYDMVTHVEDLPELNAAYNANQQLFDAYLPKPDMGVPEQLFWVAYKRGKHGADKEVPWTTVLIDNNQGFLDKWIEQRRPASKQLEKYFPSKVEDHAVKIHQSMMNTGTKETHKQLAVDLHNKWKLNQPKDESS